MEIIKLILEDNDFLMISMQQASKMFLSSCHNKNSRKGDIITDIKVFSK